MTEKDNLTEEQAEEKEQELSFQKGMEVELPPELPLVGLDNFVLFPFMIAPMIVGQADTKKLVEDVLRGNKVLGVFLKKDGEAPESFDNIHQVGALAVVLKMLKMPDGTIRLLLHGVDRIRLVEGLREEPYLVGRTERMKEPRGDHRRVQAMMKSIRQVMQEITELGQIPEDMAAAVSEVDEPGKLADLAISHLQVQVSERQEMLETANIQDRLRRTLEILHRELDLLKLGSEIQNKVAHRMDKRQREYMLREQMKAIQKELGEEGESNPDLDEFKKVIEEGKLPEDAQKAVEKEMRRLEMLHPSSPEYAVSRNYLDWLTSLPWQESTQDNIQIDPAKKILDEDHYDLTEVKERILEHLAVISLKKEIRGPILCFVGPPGVGKTSLGRSIARAMGRKFTRMSLGGMRDEAEIRGHRRTYIGSMPGRLIKSIRDCGSNNPVIMLDEIDKIGTDFRGDPASALLEVLDPEQNYSFTDHYLDLPFDLSRVMFITTANLLDPIPEPLRDRMEILKLSGYTTKEKMEIARRYLIPRAYENTGVGKNNLKFSDEGLTRIAEEYTREAGVRNLEREIHAICRKVAKNIAGGRKRFVKVGPREVETFLGHQRFFHETARRTAHPGVATGLAWTQAGGEILFVEANAVPGVGQVLLTGQLGNVMKESAMAAMNFLHAHCEELDIPDKAFTKQNFHVHVPAGATPKDGPSAGITIAVALCSLLKNEPVKDDFAMTGEITLKGLVLPVGGVKEKVLAAYRAGIKEIVLPNRCQGELNKDIPEEVRKAMHFYFVEHISDVLRMALPARAVGKLPEPEKLSSEPEKTQKRPEVEEKNKRPEERERKEGRERTEGRERKERRERREQQEEGQKSAIPDLEVPEEKEAGKTPEVKAPSLRIEPDRVKKKTHRSSRGRRGQSRSGERAAREKQPQEQPVPEKPREELPVKEQPARDEQAETSSRAEAEGRKPESRGEKPEKGPEKESAEHSDEKKPEPSAKKRTRKKTAKKTTAKKTATKKTAAKKTTKKTAAKKTTAKKSATRKTTAKKTTRRKSSNEDKKEENQDS